MVASAPPISAVEGIILARIYAYPDISAGELSEVFALSRSKVSRLLIKLEMQGYLNADPLKEDRRNKRLSFTPAGEALLEELNKLNGKISRRGCSCLSKSEYAKLLEYFDRLASGFGAERDANMFWEDELSAHRRRMVIAQRIIADRYLDAEVDLDNFHILLEIDRARTGVCSFRQLAENLPVHPSTLSRNIDRLAARGLVKKLVPDSDRRQLELSFSAQGKNKFNSWKEKIAARFQQALLAVVAFDSDQPRSFSQRELKEFIQLLAEVNASPLPLLPEFKLSAQKLRTPAELKRARAFLLEYLVREQKHLNLEERILGIANVCGQLAQEKDIQAVFEVEVRGELADLKHLALSRQLRDEERGRSALQQLIEFIFKESQCAELRIPRGVVEEKLLSDFAVAPEKGDLRLRRDSAFTSLKPLSPLN